MIDLRAFQMISDIFVALPTTFYIVIIMLGVIGGIIIAVPESRHFLGGLVGRK